MRLAICTPVGVDGKVNYQYIEGLRNIGLDYDLFVEPSHFIDDARNSLVKKTRGYDYILFVDSDIVVPKGWVERVLDYRYPVCAGLYMSKRAPYRLHAYKIIQEKLILMFKDIDDLPQEYFFADAAGCGCLLVKRNVFDSMNFPYFKTSYLGERLISEDIFFFRQLSDPVLVDPEVITHCHGLDEYPRVFTEGWASIGQKSEMVKIVEQFNYKYRQGK